MGIKTILKRLISKYGIMSVEMQKAILTDQAIIDENDNLIYADNPNSINQEIEEKANKKTIDMDDAEVIDAEVVEETKEQEEEACPF